MSEVSVLRRNPEGPEPRILQEVYRLRDKVFRERLAWDVSSQDGRERDWYDDICPVYLIASDDDGHVEGCWRLLPTIGPYMLRDVFPELLDGHPAPIAEDIWEISRFAVSPRDAGYSSLGALHRITTEMLVAPLLFCQQIGVRRVVAATDLRFERILKRAGLPVGRYGTPRRIGNVTAVSGWTDVTEGNLRRISERLRPESAVAKAPVRWRHLPPDRGLPPPATTSVPLVVSRPRPLATPPMTTIAEQSP
ncbi:MAG: GNAT family N-acetyltransferase [Proteobacteria bacterium]|nr:GNAT family N-acetyltransferase [Pseudomonadota bacterium]